MNHPRGNLLAMIIFLVKLLLANENVYSISPPFVKTDVNEINFWSIKYMSYTTKEKIYLISGIPKTRGMLCNRIPVNAKHWNININVSVARDDFWFIFSKNTCPDIDNKFFSGLRILFKPLKNNSLYIEVMGTDLISNGNILIDNIPFSDDTLLITIRKIDYLDIELTVGNINYGSVLNTRISYISYEYGYISLYANSSSEEVLSDGVRLNSLMYHPNEITKSIDLKIGDSNRKIIRDHETSRMYIKSTRRSKMAFATKYIDLMYKFKDNLPEIDEYDFIDSLNIIDDSIDRMNKSIMIHQIEQIINDVVIPPLEKLYACIENVVDGIAHKRSEYNEIIAYTIKHFNSIASYTQNQIDLVRDDAIKMALSLGEKYSRKNLNVGSINDHYLTISLKYVMLAEFVCYSLFFIYKYNSYNTKKKLY